MTLAGTLVLPPQDGGRRPPHPAVVLTHTSGPATREDYRHWAEFFAAHGVASLVYDKRGAGASTGAFRGAAYRDLAEDALAGARVLRARPDVDPRRVGLWGASQGGWIAPLAASLDRGIAFVVVQSAPGVSPARQETHRVEHQLRADGFRETEIAEAVALMRLEFRAARTGDGWEALDAAVARGRARRWFAYVSTIPRPDTIGAWRATMDYDPVPVLERVGCPLLACFGERDPYLPVRESAARLAAAGKRAGNPEVTVKVFPGANHSLIVEGPGGDLRFAAGYFGTVAE